MRENGMGVGDKMNAVGVGNVVQPFTLSTDLPFRSNILQSENMPVLHLWVLQTDAIANPATVLWEGSWRRAAGPGGTDEFFALTPSFLTTPGIPQLVVLRQTPSKMRVTFTRVAGVATTIRFALSCAAA